jgi:hypothetical protein
MILNQPSKIAICLFAVEDEKTKEQFDKIKSFDLPYELEFWLRNKKNPNSYNSFSQMVNEAIDDTDSEFMIFINPKTIFEKEDFLDIILKLCSGYCFVSIVGLGLFGSTKELFRNIGMMDERYIGSTMEDDDLCLRLNLLNKAVYYGYNKNKYENITSYNPLIRGTSTLIFIKKWNYDEDNVDCYIQKKDLINKKISKKHNLKKNEIYNSWMNKENSFVQSHVGVKIIDKKIKIINNLQEIKELTQCNILIKRNKNNFFIDYKNKNINTYPILISVYKNNGGNYLPLSGRICKPNFWHSFDPFFESRSDYEEDAIYQIRIYSEDSIVYVNNFEGDFEEKITLNLDKIIKTI